MLTLSMFTLMCGLVDGFHANFVMCCLLLLLVFSASCSVQPKWQAGRYSRQHTLSLFLHGHICVVFFFIRIDPSSVHSGVHDREVI